MPPKTKEKQADPNTQMGEANQRNILDFFPKTVEPRVMQPRMKKVGDLKCSIPGVEESIRAPSCAAVLETSTPPNTRKGEANFIPRVEESIRVPLCAAVLETSTPPNTHKGEANSKQRSAHVDVDVLEEDEEVKLAEMFSEYAQRLYDIHNRIAAENKLFWKDTPTQYDAIPKLEYFKEEIDQIEERVISCPELKARMHLTTMPEYDYITILMEAWELANETLKIAVYHIDRLPSHPSSIVQSKTPLPPDSCSKRRVVEWLGNSKQKQNEKRFEEMNKDNAISKRLSVVENPKHDFASLTGTDFRNLFTVQEDNLVQGESLTGTDFRKLFRISDDDTQVQAGSISESKLHGNQNQPDKSNYHSTDKCHNNFDRDAKLRKNHNVHGDDPGSQFSRESRDSSQRSRDLEVPPDTKSQFFQQNWRRNHVDGDDPRSNNSMRRSRYPEVPPERNLDSKIGTRPKRSEFFEQNWRKSNVPQFQPHRSKFQNYSRAQAKIRKNPIEQTYQNYREDRRYQASETQVSTPNCSGNDWVVVRTTNHPEIEKPYHYGKITELSQMFKSAFQESALYDPYYKGKDWKILAGIDIIKFNGHNLEDFQEFERGLLMKIVNNRVLNWDAKFLLLMDQVSGCPLATVQAYADKLTLENFVMAIEDLWYTYGQITSSQNFLAQKLLQAEPVNIKKLETLKNMEILITKIFTGNIPDADTMACSVTMSSINMTTETEQLFKNWLMMRQQKRSLKHFHQWLSSTYKVYSTDLLLQKL